MLCSNDFVRFSVNIQLSFAKLRKYCNSMVKDNFICQISGIRPIGYPVYYKRDIRQINWIYCRIPDIKQGQISGQIFIARYSNPPPPPTWFDGGVLSFAAGAEVLVVLRHTAQPDTLNDDHSLKELNECYEQVRKFIGKRTNRPQEL